MQYTNGVYKLGVTSFAKVNESIDDWERKLDSTIWAFCTFYKVPLTLTPFKLVYEIEAFLLLKFIVASLRVRMIREEA